MKYDDFDEANDINEISTDVHLSQEYHTLIPEEYMKQIQFKTSLDEESYAAMYLKNIDNNISEVHYGFLILF